MYNLIVLAFILIATWYIVKDTKRKLIEENTDIEQQKENIFWPS
jgi:hypothetical protein